MKTPHYNQIIKSFASWLQTLGYASSTVYGMPRQLREFLEWIEEKGVTKVESITEEQMIRFITYFKTRPNKRRSGGLSTAYVNKQIDCLIKFCKYLSSTDQLDIKITIKFIKNEGILKRTILAKREIRLLYEATDESLLGIRDRAMLGIYYGCGVRKTEGINLEVSDVLFERKLLYVRKAKNGHERYVPINKKVLLDLEKYIYDARPLLVNTKNKIEALFVSQKGTAVQGQSLILRLKMLQIKTGDSILIQKNFGLHALRHSIASHLLHAGMDLENIAIFLGHKSLDSTQIYTHLKMEEDE